MPVSEHCHFCCAGIGGLKNTYYDLLLNFSLNVVVGVQIWEFRIALDRIDQTVSLTTIISKMAYGFCSKSIFCSLPQQLRPLLPVVDLGKSYK